MSTLIETEPSVGGRLLEDALQHYYSVDLRDDVKCIKLEPEPKKDPREICCMNVYDSESDSSSSDDEFHPERENVQNKKYGEL